MQVTPVKAGNAHAFLPQIYERRSGPGAKSGL